jgi:hypothetical protein
MLNFAKNFLRGIALPLEITTSPLYRYPYRQAGEALRGDWLRIGEDVESVTQNEHMHG